MKRKKLSLMNVSDEEVLNRNEMKHIMAGSGGSSECKPSADCASFEPCKELINGIWDCSRCCLA